VNAFASIVNVSEREREREREREKLSLLKFSLKNRVKKEKIPLKS
jgi:hypothetical protein